MTYLTAKLMDELVIAAISALGIAAYTFYGIQLQVWTRHVRQRLDTIVYSRFWHNKGQGHGGTRQAARWHARSGISTHPH